MLMTIERGLVNEGSPVLVGAGSLVLQTELAAERVRMEPSAADRRVVASCSGMAVVVRYLAWHQIVKVAK